MHKSNESSFNEFVIMRWKKNQETLSFLDEEVKEQRYYFTLQKENILEQHECVKKKVKKSKLQSGALNNSMDRCAVGFVTVTYDVTYIRT